MKTSSLFNADIWRYSCRENGSFSLCVTWIRSQHNDERIRNYFFFPERGAWCPQTEVNRVVQVRESVSVCVCMWVETNSAVRLWCTGRRPTSALCTLMTPTATGQMITSGQIIFYASNLNSVYRLFTLLGFLILKWNIILRPGQQSFFVRVTEVKTLTCAEHCLQLQSDDTTYFL